VIEQCIGERQRITERPSRAFGKICFRVEGEQEESWHYPERSELFTDRSLRSNLLDFQPTRPTGAICEKPAGMECRNLTAGPFPSGEGGRDILGAPSASNAVLR
jgi:hypothetical protein